MLFGILPSDGSGQASPRDLSRSKDAQIPSLLVAHFSNLQNRHQQPNGKFVEFKNVKRTFKGKLMHFMLRYADLVKSIHVKLANKRCHVGVFIIIR